MLEDSLVAEAVVISTDAIADGQGALQLGAASRRLARGLRPRTDTRQTQNPATLTPPLRRDHGFRTTPVWLRQRRARDVIKQAIPTLVDALTNPGLSRKISETVSSLARFANTPTFTTVAR